MHYGKLRILAINYLFLKLKNTIKILSEIKKLDSGCIEERIWQEC